MMNREYKQTLNAQLKRELLRIKALINLDGQTPEKKAELFFEQALVYDYAQQYAEAITSFDKALKIKPDYHEAWNNRGSALGNLGRLEVLNNWSSGQVNIERFKDVIASYDKALEFKPDKDKAWYNIKHLRFIISLAFMRYMVRWME